MGYRKVYRTNYSFEKPLPLTEEKYELLKNSLPIYPPEENVIQEVFKKYWFNIIFAIFFPPIIILNFEFIEYYQVLNKKNRILHNYHEIIYKSIDYNDYLEKYKQIK